MKRIIVMLAIMLSSVPSLLTADACAGGRKTYKLERYGIVPDTGTDMSPLMEAALQAIKAECADADSVVLVMKRGRYDFHTTDATRREYYISNHDQPNPKAVGIALEGWRHLCLDARGADLVFHGRMLPMSLVGTTDCTLRGFSIDFETPHITQVEIVDNDPSQGTVTFRPAPWAKWRIDEGRFVSYGEGWQMQPCAGIAFDGETGHLVYRTSDIGVGTGHVREGEDGTVVAQWNDSRLTPGTVVAMRDWTRPAPGIFMYNDVRTRIEGVSVHYAEGMGLLAQMCEDITLDGFNVCMRHSLLDSKTQKLKSQKTQHRYFTTQADATHFSGCRGRIVSVGGLYEGMMDDAINIHGTYLKVVERIDESTLVGRYMHEQTYGFDWGHVGDTVQFVASRTMELLDGTATVAEIEAVDKKNVRIRFAQPLPAGVTPEASIGMENLTWTPSVLFARNTIRNNRARGALFSTPRRTVCEENLFDHTSGTAILLCGDCNGWYETGACRDVTIRRNRFVNALTNMFQFTNGVISIYPEIPELDKQERYFHSGIVIEENEFDTFDYPLLYAKSVDGLVFRRNTVRYNRDFPPYHHIKQRVMLERVVNATVE